MASSSQVQAQLTECVETLMKLRITVFRERNFMGPHREETTEILEVRKYTDSSFFRNRHVPNSSRFWKSNYVLFLFMIPAIFMWARLTKLYYLWPKELWLEHVEHVRDRFRWHILIFFSFLGGQGLGLSFRLEYSGTIIAHCSLTPLGSGEPLTLAFPSVEFKGVSLRAWTD